MALIRKKKKRNEVVEDQTCRITLWLRSCCCLTLGCAEADKDSWQTAPSTRCQQRAEGPRKGQDFEEWRK